MLNEIKKDIMDLRGSEVRVFGQKVTLPSDYSEDDLVIDILDVIDSLKDYEMNDYFEDIQYNEDDEEEWVNIFEGCEDCEDEIDALEKYRYIKNIYDYRGDNSYNWSSPISNNFDIAIYEDIGTGTNGVFIEFKVHRFGDVRGNYTESALLHFDSLDEWYEVMSENNKYLTLEIDGISYDFTVDIFSHSFEVFNAESGEYVCNAYGCDIDEVKECIIEKLNNRE